MHGCQHPNPTLNDNPLSAETLRVHVKDNTHILGETRLRQDRLNVLCQRSSAERAKGDLEAKLPMCFDEGRGQNFTEGDAIGKILREADVEGFQGELGPALMIGA